MSRASFRRVRRLTPDVPELSRHPGPGAFDDANLNQTATSEA
jgi:hypothetical protein